MPLHCVFQAEAKGNSPGLDSHFCSLSSSKCNHLLLTTNFFSAVCVIPCACALVCLCECAIDKHCSVISADTCEEGRSLRCNKCFKSLGGPCMALWSFLSLWNRDYMCMLTICISKAPVNFRFVCGHLEHVVCFYGACTWQLII